MSNELIKKSDNKNLSIGLMPQNTNDLLVMSEMLSKSNFVPVSMQGSPEDVFSCIAFGLEVGLKPMQALQNIAVINGRPSLYGDSMLAIVMGSAVFGSVKETFDDKTMTAICTASRKDGTTNTQTFSKQDAELAGLWMRQSAKGNSMPWSSYPKRMLKMRARSFCLRDTFPDILSGIIASEEAQDYPQSESDIQEPQVTVILSITEQIESAQTMDDLMGIYSQCSQSEKEEYRQFFSDKKEVINNGK